MNKINLFNKLTVWALACAAVWGAVGCVADIENRNQAQDGNVQVGFEVSSAQDEICRMTKRHSLVQRYKNDPMIASWN